MGRDSRGGEGPFRERCGYAIGGGGDGKKVFGRRRRELRGPKMINLEI